MVVIGRDRGRVCAFDRVVVVREPAVVEVELSSLTVGFSGVVSGRAIIALVAFCAWSLSVVESGSTVDNAVARIVKRKRRSGDMMMQ